MTIVRVVEFIVLVAAFVGAAYIVIKTTASKGDNK